MTIPEWAVGFFFGGLSTGFLTVAALIAATRYVKKREENR